MTFWGPASGNHSWLQLEPREGRNGRMGGKGAMKKEGQREVGQSGDRGGTGAEVCRQDWLIAARRQSCLPAAQPQT